MEQAFTAQNRGLLTMRGRLVLGHHPRLVLGGEATPGRPWRRIDRPRPVLLGRLLVAAHVRISSHALQANPDRRGVSQQPDREGCGGATKAGTSGRTSNSPTRGLAVTTRASAMATTKAVMSTGNARSLSDGTHAWM